MTDVSHCPYCSNFTLEHLAARSVCWDCGYCPEFHSETGIWQRMEFSHPRSKHIQPIQYKDQILKKSDPNT